MAIELPSKRLAKTYMIEFQNGFVIVPIWISRTRLCVHQSRNKKLTQCGSSQINPSIEIDGRSSSLRETGYARCLTLSANVSTSEFLPWKESINEVKNSKPSKGAADSVQVHKGYYMGRSNNANVWAFYIILHHFTSFYCDLPIIVKVWVGNTMTFLYTSSLKA